MIKSNVRASFNVICIPAAKWLEQIILNSGELRQASGEWRCEVKLCLHWLVSVEVTVLTGNWRKQKKWTKNTQKGKLQSTLDFLFPDLLIWVRAWPCDFDYKQQWPMSRRIISGVSQELGMDPPHLYIYRYGCTVQKIRSSEVFHTKKLYASLSLNRTIKVLLLLNLIKSKSNCFIATILQI